MISSITELIDALDGPTRISKVLGCTPQNVSLWPLRKAIPTGWHYMLHLMLEAKGIAYDKHKLFGIPRGFAK